MQIYTRYKTTRRRWSLRVILQLALTAAGLGLVGWILYQAAPDGPRTVEGSGRPRPAGPPRPSSGMTAPAPTNTVGPVRTNLVRPPAPGLTNVIVTRPASSVPAGAPPAGLESAFAPRPARDVLEAQVALASRGFSSGSIDGVLGHQTRAALRAFQRQARVPATGALDPATAARLTLSAPPLTLYVVQPEDLSRLLPVSRTWLGKSRQPRLDYATLGEFVAEKHRMHPDLLARLNPGIARTNGAAGLVLNVVNVPAPAISGRLAFLRIALQDRVLSGYDARTNLLFHFPCSIGARLEKRPVGRLTVVTAALNPTYTFNPAIFPESAEARRLGRKLTLPPGPNNPVGVAWIGLDRPGYGIHGTPRPEDVGRTESHGCFRLANWDAAVLAPLVSPGLPVYVDY